MPLVVQIGYDTIQRLEEAARRRFDEAEVLLRNEQYLGAIYLFGYVAEMLIKSAYYRTLGIGENDEIDRDRRGRLDASARTKVEKEIGNREIELFNNVWPNNRTKAELMKIERSHPIFGFALLLCEKLKPTDRAGLSNEVMTHAAAIRRNWSPTLRYHVVNPDPSETNEVRTASKWFLENYDKIAK